MAHRLKKLAQVSYTPGTPSTPFRPGYCVQVPYSVPGYVDPGNSGWFFARTSPAGGSAGLQVGGVNASGVGFSNQYQPSQFSPPRTAYRQECFPAQPAVAAVPAELTFTSVNGWNGGARSVAQLNGDGFVEFQVSDVPAAVVVGLSISDESLLPSDPTHALYIRGTTIDVIESGFIVHTASIPHAYARVYRIQRVGTTVTYSTLGWSYQSAVQSTGPRVLDAAIFAAGDYVDNPRLVSTPATGRAVGAMPSLVGRGYVGAYAEAYGTLPSLSGVAGSLFTTRAAGSLASLVGVASEGAYNYVTGSLRPLSGDANGGYPSFSLIQGIGGLAALNGIATGLTGSVGVVAASLPAMAGWASEGAYAEARGSLQPLGGYADAGWPIPRQIYATDVALAGDYYFASDVQTATIGDALSVSDTFVVTIQVADAIFDALMLQDSTTAQAAIDAFIGASLLVGNGFNSTYKPEDGVAGRMLGEPVQYAVNTLTNAFTNYSGFDFSSFANVGQTLYGAKADGVYRVRAGDDNGVGVDAVVDFGATTFGSIYSKTVEAVYLGVSTDGQLFVRMDADEDSRLYRVVQRGDTMRALTAKGIASRMWNVTLEIVDATEFELDIIEIQVGVASGRWRSR